jgi:hypothetical protein
MQDERHNAYTDHNASITARPRIFFAAKVKESLVRDVLGVTHQRREFTPVFFLPGSTENAELTASVSKEDQATFKALLALRCAISSDEPIGKLLLASAIKLLVENHPGDASEYARVTDVRQVARNIYPALLSEKLKRVRIIITRDFVPAMLCPDITTAMFCFASFRGVAVCLNCQKIFAYDAPRADGTASEKYCTARCGTLYRQKNYRLRVAQKSKRKERKR